MRLRHLVPAALAAVTLAAAGAATPSVRFNSLLALGPGLPESLRLTTLEVNPLIFCEVVVFSNRAGDGGRMCVCRKP